MDLLILFWNYQGVSSLEFQRAFNSLISSYKADIVAVLEPKVSGLKAVKFIKTSGFHRSHRVEADNFSGGIWILWSNGFNVDIVINHKQFVHFKVTNMIGVWSWVTAVYASPINVVRMQLWSELGKMSNYIKGPWLLGGDFNTILHDEEKKGGSPKNRGACRYFSRWFHNAKMIDLKFKGLRFTWSRGLLFKRLDREICNDE